MKTTETLESIIKIPEIAERIANHLLFADFSRLHCVSKKIFGCLYDTLRWEKEGEQRFGTLMPEPKIVRARAAYLYLKTEYSPKGRTYDNVILDFSKGTLNLVPLHAKRRSGPQPIRSRLPLAPSLDQLAKQFREAPTKRLARALNILVQRPPSKEDLRRKIEQGGMIKITSPTGRVWQAKPHIIVRGKTECLLILDLKGETLARLLKTRTRSGWTPIYRKQTSFPLDVYLTHSEGLRQWGWRAVAICEFMSNGGLDRLIERNGFRIRESLKPIVVNVSLSVTEKLCIPIRSAISSIIRALP